MATWAVSWYNKDPKGEITGGSMADPVDGDNSEAAAQAAAAVGRKASDPGRGTRDGLCLLIMKPLDDVWPIQNGTRIVSHRVWLRGGAFLKIGRPILSTW